jgi:hypothetical protein
MSEGKNIILIPDYHPEDIEFRWLNQATGAPPGMTSGSPDWTSWCTPTSIALCRNTTPPSSGWGSCEL